MTRREKAIVVIMAGAVVYGAVEGVLGGMRRMSAESAAKSAAPPETSALVASLQQHASLGGLDAAERKALAAAVAPWGASPFVGEKPVWQEPAVAIVPAHYTGFLQVGGTRIGILDGREYRPGETLASGDFVVVDVKPGSATLRSVHGNRLVTVPVEGKP